MSASSAMSQTVPQEPVPSTCINEAIVTSLLVGTMPGGMALEPSAPPWRRGKEGTAYFWVSDTPDARLR